MGPLALDRHVYTVPAGTVVPSKLVPAAILVPGGTCGKSSYLAPVPGLQEKVRTLVPAGASGDWYLQVPNVCVWGGGGPLYGTMPTFKLKRHLEPCPSPSSYLVPAQVPNQAKSPPSQKFVPGT